MDSGLVVEFLCSSHVYAYLVFCFSSHLAMVGGETKDKIRINMRATEEFHNKTGVHLGRDVAIPLGKQLGGAGGGHPTAAGLSAQGEAKNLLRMCVERVRECLGPLQT